MSKQKSRITALLVALVLAPAWVGVGAQQAPADTRGLLWEIRSGGAAPSYLLGTMHSSLTLEVIIDPAAMTALGQRMLLPPRHSLRDMLDERTWRRMAEAMRQRQVPEASLERLRPWAVAMTLSMPQQSTGMALDLYLQQYAVRLGKPLHALESIDEQVGVFESLTQAEQVKLLRTTLEQLPELPALVEALTTAYLARDLAAMQSLTEAQLAIGDRAFNRRFLARLIDDRNARMLQRLQPRLREGGALIAVGAMHLPGERGLLRLLRDQGHAVRALY